MPHRKKKNKLIDQLFNGKAGIGQLFVLVGKSGKGKSYFVRYLLTDRLSRGIWKFGLVFTRTKFNDDYSFLPDKRVLEGYDENILRKYINNLRSIRKEKGKIEPNFIVFDDLQGILNNSTNYFNNFLSTFRHTNTNILVCNQYLAGKNAVSTLAREQTNYAILFQSRTRRTLENLYESYGGLFPTLDAFKQYFLKATKEPYSAMLYSEDVDTLEENYITIMAPEDYPEMEFDF
jgi:hypothetical protein